jgi:hypothetical protein
MDGFDRQDTQSIGAPDPVWQVRRLADFNAEAKADILRRDTSRGTIVIWLMDQFMKLDSGGLGDSDGDRQSDSVWRESNSGEIVVWRIDILARAAAQAIGAVPLVWQVQQDLCRLAARASDHGGC